MFSSKSLLLVIFAAFLSALSENVDARKLCPEAKTILPCKCFDNRAYSKLYCDGVGDFTKVKAKLAGFPPFLELFMKNINQSTLDKISLSGIRVTGFELADSKISHVPKHMFLGQEYNLVRITIQNTFLDRIPRSALSKLTRLRYLTISHSKTMKIVKADIDGLPSGIQTFAIDTTHVTSIENESFRKLTNLNRLVLIKCSLKSLPPSLGVPSTLTYLMVTDSKLTEVPIAALKTLSNVKIDFSNNQITSLPSAGLMKALLDKNNEINLYGNKLRCTCDFKWIAEYYHLHRRYSKGSINGRCAAIGGKDKRRDGKYVQDFRLEDFSDCK